MLGALQRDEKTMTFADEVRTPVAPAISAEGLLLALDKARGTTIHLGGPQRITRFEIGRLAAEVAGLDARRLWRAGAATFRWRFRDRGMCHSTALAPRPSGIGRRRFVSSSSGLSLLRPRDLERIRLPVRAARRRPNPGIAIRSFLPSIRA